MNLLQPNKLWIEQADAAIRKINPTAAEVVEATRGFAVLGREGVLTGDEIAARARLHESFQ